MWSLDNLEAVLREAGYGLADVIRLNYYVTDVDAFIQAGEVYGARLAQASAGRRRRCSGSSGSRSPR